jgi:hypothetical protein
LAWAKKNHVTPPAYAVLTDESLPNPNSQVELRRKVKLLGTGVKTCGSSQKSTVAGDCCDQSPKIARSCSSVETEASAKVQNAVASDSFSQRSRSTTSVNPGAVKTKSNRKVVLAMLALKCRGEHFVFAHIPWGVPTSRADGMLMNVREEKHVPLVIGVPASILPQPDTPPPKTLSI